MSGHTDTPTRSNSTSHDTTTCNAALTIRARDDTDGCACLECRNIETTATRRTVLDTLVWSVRLFRSYPSIVAFASLIILANRILETDSINVLPLPVVGVFETLTALAFVVLIRAYVGTIAASELTHNPVTTREGLRRCLARTPALLGLILFVVFSAMTIPFLVFLPLLMLVGAIPGNLVEIVGLPVAAAVGGIVFAVPFLFLLFKFWFAPEACVIGRYGPIESLQVSWRITTNYRRKFVLVGVIAIGSAFNLSLPTMFPGLSGGLAPVSPILDAISSSVGDLISIVWASAYAHIYVQEVVS